MRNDGFPSVPRGADGKRVDLTRARAQAALAHIAADFGIAESALHALLRQAEAEDGTRTVATVEDGELRLRNQRLEQENAVLKRAVAYLSQAKMGLGGAES